MPRLVFVLHSPPWSQHLTGCLHLFAPVLTFSQLVHYKQRSHTLNNWLLFFLILTNNLISRFFQLFQGVHPGFHLSVHLVHHFKLPKLQVWFTVFQMASQHHLHLSQGVHLGQVPPKGSGHLQFVRIAKMPPKMQARVSNPMLNQLLTHCDLKPLHLD